MVDREIIKEWIAKADEDFEFAEINLEEEKPFYAQICFHFQQAVEKYLKAYIITNGLEFRRVHDLPSDLLKISAIS
jgi:HEPN domain-containing protein